MYYRLAFTVAELMVVLGILSIIAGVFFLVVSNSAPNPEEKYHQKAAYQLEQTAANMYNDDNMYPENNVYTKQGFKNTDNVIIKGKQYGGDTKFCKLFASQFKKKTEDVVCADEGDFSTVSFKTTDNMNWYVPSSDFTNGYTTVYADVNGDDIGYLNKTNACFYNSTTCPNPDMHKFYVRGYNDEYNAH